MGAEIEIAHGISAGMDEVGAIISALAFNTLSEKIGTPVILWIFLRCCMFSALFTLFLPEVRRYDSDEVLAEEIREKHAEREGTAGARSVVAAN